MSRENYTNCEEIIARAKTFLNVHTGKDLAIALGVSENAISTWKKRKTLDMGKILLACEGVNQEWLLTGEGEATQSINNSGNEEEEMAYRDKYETLMEKYIAMMEENSILKEQLLKKAPLSKTKVS
jgi:transcriptional regulator with XRE-family HTH domain